MCICVCFVYRIFLLILFSPLSFGLNIAVLCRGLHETEMKTKFLYFRRLMAGAFFL